MSATRAEAAGDMMVIRGKLAGKYDTDLEREVIAWFKALLNEELVPGLREMEKQLRNGQLLVRLAQHIQQNSPTIPERARKMTLKANNLPASFKQMENIQTFITFCQHYGVPKGAQFQTVDLFEGRNMGQVLSCLEMLGSECQRNGFNGATIGPKPQEKNKRDWTVEQKRAGHSIIGLQAGTNKLASQKGMTIGGVRHVADIRADDMNKDGKAILTLQSGTHKYATQAGMSMGSVRHGSDIRADEMNKEGMTMLTLQSGTNKFATQAGMTAVGAVRHVSDIRADDLNKDGMGILTLQGGTNKFATQAGMQIGGVRHAADIRADDMTKESYGSVGFQAGSNKYATQAGMNIGGVRHGGDTKVDDMAREGQGVLGLQTGTNLGATQAGMVMGGIRHIADIRADQVVDQAGQGMMSQQLIGQAGGANQTGMSMGGRRDIIMSHPPVEI